MQKKVVKTNVNGKYKIYKLYEMPKFTGKNVPVKEVAKLMGKDQQFIRQGIIRGLLPIGTAFKKTITDSKWGETKESSQYDFYISPKLLWEYTGIIYNEDTKLNKSSI